MAGIAKPVERPDNFITSADAKALSDKINEPFASEFLNKGVILLHQCRRNGLIAISGHIA